jgi:hypothetical protein
MKIIGRSTLFIFSLVFLVNSYLTPLMGDDYAHFQLSLGGRSLLENMIINLNTMYWNWCGRMLVHFFDGLVLASQSRLVFSLVNLAFLIVIFELIQQKIGAKKTELRSLVWALGAFLIAFGTKSHFQVLYLTTGAANYFWSFALIVSYLYFFSFLFRRNVVAPEATRLKIFGFCLLSFLTGSTNENVGMCLLAIFFLGELESFWKKKSLLPKWVWLTQGWLAVGSAILILAPGNYVRLQVLYPNGLPGLQERLQWWFESLAIFLGRPDPLIFFLTLIGSIFYIDKGLFKKGSYLFAEHGKLFILSFLMIFVFLGNDGNFYGRKGIHSFLILGFYAILIFVKMLDLSSLNTHKLKRVGMTIAFLAIARVGFDLYLVLEVHDVYTRREAQILNENKLGTSPITTCAIDTIFSLEDLSHKSDDGLNRLYAQYIGVGPVVSNYQPCNVFLSSR